MSEYSNFNDNDKKPYNDLCAPASTLAVGLNSCVVLQPETADNVIVVSNKVTLTVATLLLYFLQVLDSIDIINS